MKKYSTGAEPPNFLDGAKVIKWAWSGEIPFGHLTYTNGTDKIEIYGLAVCQYEDSKSIYRFSCDRDWEVQQDSPHDTIENAIEELPQQYKNVEPIWYPK